MSEADIDEYRPGDASAWGQDHGALARLVRRADFVTMSWRALRRGRWDGANVAVVAVRVDGTAGARNDAGLPDDGGAVRQAVAKRILDAAGPASVAARVGPDEFVLLCSDLRTPGDAALTASRIRDALTEPAAVHADGTPDLAAAVLHRLSGVGLTLQSMATRAPAPAAERMERAADELDAIIRDVRTMAFRAAARD